MTFCSCRRRTESEPQTGTEWQHSRAISGEKRKIFNAKRRFMVHSEVLKPASNINHLYAPTLETGALKHKGYFGRCTHLFGERR
jgi:hypothetical protein